MICLHATVVQSSMQAARRISLACFDSFLVRTTFPMCDEPAERRILFLELAPLRAGEECGSLCFATMHDFRTRSLRARQVRECRRFPSAGIPFGM